MTKKVATVRAKKIMTKKVAKVIAKKLTKKEQVIIITIP